MKQLDNIILVTDTVEEIYEVFRTTFPELDGQVKGWSLWRCCDEQFRGIVGRSVLRSWSRPRKRPSKPADA